MKIVQSTNYDDWNMASSILGEVIDWLNSEKKPLWSKEQVSVKGLQKSYKLTELYFLKLGSEIVGLVFIQTHDPLFWPEMNGSDSIYIHKLCLLRAYKGRKHGFKAIELLKELGASMGRQYMRLDCDVRDNLLSFYKSNGFHLVDYRNVQGFNVARFETQIRIQL